MQRSQPPHRHHDVAAVGDVDDGDTTERRRWATRRVETLELRELRLDVEQKNGLTTAALDD